MRAVSLNAGGTKGQRLSAPSVASPTSLPAHAVLRTLEEHVLTDGFRLVIDLERSRGSWLVDAASGQELLDFYGFYGSMPVGFNHPWLHQPEVQAELLQAARTKVANSDVYSVPYANFVTTFHRVMGLPQLERYFFIEGGTLAVENALKAAIDWKVRKNLQAGRGERGTEILHFEHAFHGRSGYALSLTNTDPRKTEHFPKFDWPRVPAPAINFALPETRRISEAAEREHELEIRIRHILEERSTDIAAIITEPIQGEGGDNHFRGEWLATLRRLCDEHEVLLIFDEVQTGIGTTGKNWCFQHFSVVPDLVAFAKKAQLGGVMAGARLDQVAENCFRLPSRINSTWGGGLVDMVRSTHSLRIIESEGLVENARAMGTRLLNGLEGLAQEEPVISAPRGRGLMVAFDLPNKVLREKFYTGLFELGLLALRCGERSIRFRPALDIPTQAVDQGLELLRQQCIRMRHHALVP